MPNHLRNSSLGCVIRFPGNWVDASKFEAALRASGGPLTAQTDAGFVFPINCKIMVDSGIRLLSLVNQLAYDRRHVRLEFEEGEAGTMGYLNRMGFFDHLAHDVEVKPCRPLYSGANLHRGSNAALVEIARINKDSRDDELPTRLTSPSGERRLVVLSDLAESSTPRRSRRTGMCPRWRIWTRRVGSGGTSAGPKP